MQYLAEGTASSNFGIAIVASPYYASQEHKSCAFEDIEESDLPRGGSLATEVNVEMRLIEFVVVAAPRSKA